MRHAVLGAGGIGGLIAAALARSGEDVLLLMRAESVPRYSGVIAIESRVLGDFTVAVPALPMLERAVDVLWVTTKATGLAATPVMAPPNYLSGGTVIPLMNGVDHLAWLRSRYVTVVAGAIRVESERVAPGHIRQVSPFCRVELSGAEAAARSLTSAGIDCRVTSDEVSLLWQKLVLLAPLALATTAFAASLGDVRHDDLYLQSQDEARIVATACGARIDIEALETLRAAAPDTMRSSMQRDVEEGNAPELDAIAGPILRGGRAHGIETPAVHALVDRVIARVISTRDEN